MHFLGVLAVAAATVPSVFATQPLEAALFARQVQSNGNCADSGFTCGGVCVTATEACCPDGKTICDSTTESCQVDFNTHGWLCCPNGQDCTRSGGNSGVKGSPAGTSSAAAAATAATSSSTSAPAAVSSPTSASSAAANSETSTGTSTATASTSTASAKSGASKDAIVDVMGVAGIVAGVTALL